jgi:hypothetical protein
MRFGNRESTAVTFDLIKKLKALLIGLEMGLDVPKFG